MTNSDDKELPFRTRRPQNEYENTVEDKWEIIKQIRMLYDLQF
jgi:hypothetical protein